jgi:methylthioxylose transferase
VAEPIDIDPAAARHRTWRRALGVGAGASLVTCLLVAARLVPIGSQSGNWVYGYLQPFRLRILAVALVAGVLVHVATVIATDTIERHQWATVVACLVVGLTAQILMRTLTPIGMNRMFTSSGTNAFYEVAASYAPSTVLRDFNSLRQTWPLHARSNMPGKVIVVSALERVSDRPRILAWLVLVLSNLGGLLMYGFVRDLFNDRRVALFSLVLYLLVPGKLYFFPLMNTVTPAVLMPVLWLSLRWILTGSSLFAMGTGVALYGLVFFEPLPLVMGVVPGALAIATLRRNGGWSRVAIQAGLCMLTLVAVHAFVRWRYGFDAIDTLRLLTTEAVGFNADAERPYLLWLGQNLLDFLFAVGVCQGVVFLGVLRETPRRIREPIAVLCASLAVALFVLDLAGVNRGEVVRLWIFLACAFQIPAAYVCARLNSRLALTLVIATTILQDALGTAMIGFVVP